MQLFGSCKPSLNSSPDARARKATNLVKELLEPRFDERIYKTDGPRCWKPLESIPDKATIAMLVGHNCDLKKSFGPPHWGRSPHINGSFSKLEFEVQRWREAANLDQTNLPWG